MNASAVMVEVAALVKVVMVMEVAASARKVNLIRIWE